MINEYSTCRTSRPNTVIFKFLEASGMVVCNFDSNKILSKLTSFGPIMASFTLLLTMLPIINCQDHQIIFLDPFYHPNDTYPWLWTEEVYWGLVWGRRSYYCTRYFGSGQCINIYPMTIISRIIPTTSFHSLYIQIGM